MTTKEAIRIATEMVTETYSINENGNKIMAKLERSNAALREARVEKSLVLLGIDKEVARDRMYYLYDGALDMKENVECIISVFGNV